MVAENEPNCPNCGEELKHYDNVQRIVRTKGRKTEWITIQRLRCPCCGTLHRELPDYIYPYKQYEIEVIKGVLEGFISNNTLGYEDYPCEMTIKRWKNAQNLQILVG